MKVLDAKLDDAPTDNDVKELAELRIRNLLCFRELQSLNDTGRFINQHPILCHEKEFDELLLLWRTNREQFIRQYENCKNNIRRYQGRATRSGATEQDIAQARYHKARHEERESIFKKIISNEQSN